MLMMLNASGCLDALVAPDVARSLDAFVTKTVTPEPREGNEPTRIAETDHGMLNSIGLQNPGRERFLHEVLPELRGLGVPLWVSVGGFAAHEYAETCSRLHDVTIELNLSCPNVDEAPESAAEIVAACRESTALRIYAKLSPAQPDIGAAARAVQAAGADGLSLVNTIRGLELDPATLRPRLARGVGGYSGTRAEAGRSGRRLRRFPCHEPAHRRHGRHPQRARRGRVSRRRRKLGRGGDRALRRPRHTRADQAGVGRDGRVSRHLRSEGPARNRPRTRLRPPGASIDNG